MGGKGGGSAPPPPPVQDNSGEMMQMMMGMMSMMKDMGKMSAQAPPLPPPIPMPEVAKTHAVNWKAKQSELDAKAKADALHASTKRKNRVSTLHASLTDQGGDTEMSQTPSLLGGDDDQ